MYRFINGQDAYSFFNNSAFMIATFCSLLFISAKLKAPGIFAKYFSILASRKSKKVGKIVFVIVAAIELYLSARHVIYTSVATSTFGRMVGTGANYFGLLFLIPIALLAVSIVFVVDPLKNSDVLTMTFPIFLFVIKLACFFNGCCWGIPWEGGLYNHHPNHPGYQVPVQLFEIICAIVIFIFLLIYRKKAKPGKLLPMYMIIYSATRFPIEFLSAAHKPILGPFNTYHFLCIAGIVYGLIILLVVKYFGEKITSYFEKYHIKLEAKLAVVKPKKMTQKELDAEAERLARLEKAKLAREKAKARNKTKTRKK